MLGARVGARLGAGDPVFTGTLKEEIQVVRVPPCRLENTDSTSVSALDSTVNNFKKWNCSSLILIPNYAPDSTMLEKQKNQNDLFSLFSSPNNKIEDFVGKKKKFINT